MLVHVVDCPIASFTWVMPRPCNLYEALVETEIVPDGVLPAWVCLVLVIDKLVLDPCIDI